LSPLLRNKNYDTWAQKYLEKLISSNEMDSLEMSQNHDHPRSKKNARNQQALKCNISK
jgi:hypothetical protein